MCEIVTEAEQTNLFDAECVETFKALLDRSDEFGRVVRCEHLGGVWIERHHRRDFVPLSGVRKFQEKLKHALVTTVQSVKHANRDARCAITYVGCLSVSYD